MAAPARSAPSADEPGASDARPYGQSSCTVCTSTCELVPGRLTGFCGDGAKQPNEACDTHAIGSTCVDHGFVWGTMGCNADCTVDTSQCHNSADPCAGKPKTYAGNLWIGDNMMNLLPPGIDLQCLESITGATSTFLLRGPYNNFPSPILPRLRSATIMAVESWPAQNPVPALATITTLQVKASNTHVDLDTLINFSSGNITIQGPSTTNLTLTVTAYGTLGITPTSGTNTNLALNLPGVTTFGGRRLDFRGSATLNAPAADTAAPLGVTLIGGPMVGFSRFTQISTLRCEASNDLSGLARVTVDLIVGANSCASTDGGPYLPRLTQITSGLTVSGNGGSLHLPRLQKVRTLSVDATMNPGLTTLSFPKLTEITNGMTVKDLPALTGMLMPRLATIPSGPMVVTNNPQLSTCQVRTIREQLSPRASVAPGESAASGSPSRRTQSRSSCTQTSAAASARAPGRISRIGSSTTEHTPDTGTCGNASPSSARIAAGSENSSTNRLTRLDSAMRNPGRSAMSLAARPATVMRPRSARSRSCEPRNDTSACASDNVGSFSDRPVRGERPMKSP